jgi:flavin-dependent dehydrogenase
MEFDVLIVVVGPACLAAAFRLKQLAAQRDREIGVCVIEKGRRSAPIFCPGRSWTHGRCAPGHQRRLCFARLAARQHHS